MKRACYLMLMAMCVLTLVVPTDAKPVARVKAWAGKVTIPTYQMNPGDLNPRIQELDNSLGSMTYPYTQQDNFTTNCVAQDYRALFLENEYLKITFLPDINGRMQSVIDKTSNKEVFHANDCIRPARIALRGAWISGGVEWNPGPQNHTVFSYEPCNTAMEQHPDGSASVVISDTLADSGLRWQVRVTLRPGKAVIDEQIRLANPTDASRPYYFWNNTSFPNNGNGTRIIWPATLIMDHFGTKFTRWPIDNGVDQSCMKNYQDTAAMFTRNCIFDFFGAYNSDMDRGIVQYGDHRVLPGKKCWTWGKSNYGVMRQQFLGEKDTEYIEVQSGPLPTQSDYEFLDPHRQIEWQECWYPVHGLGNGFEYCTRDLAVQTDRPGADLKIRMLATAAYDKARVSVERRGDVLAEETVSLNPKDVYTLNLAGAAKEPVRIVVKASDGRVLADYQSPLQIPYEEIPLLPEKPKTQTAETLYITAQKQEKNSDRVVARETYEQALKLDPNHLGAMRGLANLDIASGRYDKALERLNKVLTAQPADGQALYLAAVCQFWCGRFDESLSRAYEALRRPETRGLGWDMAGRIYLRRDQIDPAIYAFRQAVAADPADLRARDHLLMAVMAKKDIPALRELADITFVDDPTNLVGWYAQTVGMKVKMAKPTLGNPDYSATQAAAAFAEVGRYAEAENVITAICGSKPQNRLVIYWLAWLAERQGQSEKAAKLRAEAAATPTEGVYASNPMAIAVLNEAIVKNPGDARATADLGNILAGLNRVEDAVPIWKKAIEIDPKQAVAWRNLGLYEWKAKGNLKEAERCYAAAVKANPADETYWRDQAVVMVQDKRPAEAIKLLKSMPDNGRITRDDIRLTIVRADLEIGEYDDAIQYLTNYWYTVGEFQTDSHELFVKALVGRGKKSFDKGDYQAALADFQKALEYPGNLGIGRRSQPSEAIQYYWIGKTLEKMGKKEEARTAWTTGAGQTPRASGSTREQPQYIKLCADSLKTL